MPSVPEQLEKMAALLDKGLLTREEFEEQKNTLLTQARSGSYPPVDQPDLVQAEGRDLTGQLVGEYRLESKLGEGGMGTVYLASHETLAQRVAVKVLDPSLSRNPEIRTRFIQEANIQISLAHPGVVRVLTADTQGEHLALVMEYVEGQSLEQALDRHGALPQDKALHLFQQVLEAVAYAHGRGVVHRDLKPSNIMVPPDGAAKVMDFGIAKVLGGAKLTRTGTLMGTSFYMSPEQVLGRSDIDHRTDVYSLGVTFFEALTGRLPFDVAPDESTDSDFLVKQAHVQGAPPDPRSIRPDIPEPIALALLRALEKDPVVRFQSCGEFAVALGMAGGEAGMAASQMPAPMPPPVTAAPPAPPMTPSTPPGAPYPGPQAAPGFQGGWAQQQQPGPQQAWGGAQPMGQPMGQPMAQGQYYPGQGVQGGFGLGDAPARPISKGFFLGSVLGGGALGLVSLIGAAIAFEEWEEELGGFLLILALAAVVYSGIVMMVFVYRMWASLPLWAARTTPGAAIGLMFVPFYNFYWVFQVYLGWTQDYNRMALSENAPLPRMPEGLAMTICIMTVAGAVPYLGMLFSMTNLVLLPIFMVKACDGINALALEADAAPSTPEFY